MATPQDAIAATTLAMGTPRMAIMQTMRITQSPILTKELRKDLTVESILVNFLPLGKILSIPLIMREPMIQVRIAARSLSPTVCATPMSQLRKFSIIIDIPFNMNFIKYIIPH
jgi:hypothetical protein